MCITKLWPQANWKIVWKNLHDTPVPKSSRAAWYRVIHDIIPMNDRLHRIRLTPTGNCRICDKKDTLKHRIVDSGEGKMMWTWTKQQLAQMLRTVPVHIPDGWLTCPQVILWPPQSNCALLWMMANLITFHIQKQWDLMLQDIIDFLKWTKWKL